jgi:hypothetical protein
MDKNEVNNNKIYNIGGGFTYTLAMSEVKGTGVSMSKGCDCDG